MIRIRIYIVAPYFTPPFEITGPENGDSVGMIYIIRGHGAIPGSSVKIYVLDDIGNEWIQNTVSTIQSGDWEMQKTIFGRATSENIKQISLYMPLP